MNILAQIFNYGTNNFAINCIKSKFNQTINHCFEQLLTDFSILKYESFILKLQEDMQDITKELVVAILETIDLEYKKSDERKINYHINKSNIKRTIYTIFGEITFKRTLYKDKNTNKYFFYVDEIMNLERYKTYDCVVRAICLNDSINTIPNKTAYNSPLKVLDILASLKNNIPIISKSTIYRWTRTIKINEVAYDTINNGKTLYVMADEKWIHEQNKKLKKNKKYIMSKCFVVFTGIKRKKRRSKLIGKHVFITTSDSPYKELMDRISKIYDFEKIERINLLSDAGPWILAGKNELKLYSNNQIVVNTCEFHVKQKINRTTTNKDLREQLITAIYEDEDKKKFISIMDSIIESNDKEKRKQKIAEYKNYIIKHWNGIIAMKYCDIKSSMEAHISHCVADKFGSRPKGYSRNNIETYLKLQELYLNGINIIDWYLKTYNNTEYIYNEKEVSFSVFDKKQSNIPLMSSKNKTSQLIYNIARFA